MKDTRKIVQGVYSTGSQSVLNEYYRNWARNYDDDVMVRMGYKAPIQAAEAFHLDLSQSLSSHSRLKHSESQR